LNVSISARCTLVALALAGAGCSTIEQDDPLVIQCTIVDGDGHLYTASDEDELIAVESAMTICEEEAVEPTSCLTRNCGP
jgi:hypothetical protein